MIFLRDNLIKDQIRKDSRLSPAAKLFMQYIIEQTDDTLTIEESNSYIAEVLGCTPATVSKWVNRLAKYDYVEVEHYFDCFAQRRRKIHINPKLVFGPDWTAVQVDTNKGPMWIEMDRHKIKNA